MSHPSAKDSQRIPCLDGLRTVSIAFVLLAHSMGTQNFPEMSERAHQFFDLGHLGVRVFFVISGFLITTLLIAEHEKYGRISLKHFYFRRTFRIFPAFYVFIACIAIGDQLGWIDLRLRDLVHAVTYTTNYHYDTRAWELGHLWSLSVEEQFYLLWPATLLLLGLRRGFIAAGACIVVVPALRVATWKFFPDSRIGIDESFHTIADAIATGCVLAAARAWLWERRWYRTLLRPAPMLLVLVGIFAANYLQGHIRFSYTIGETATNIGIALIVDWCLRHPEGRVGDLLNTRLMVYIGGLSYSLYLWQQIFLNRSGQHAIHAFPLNIALAFAAALVSYYAIEKPFLRYRSSFERRLFAKRTPVHKSNATSSDAPRSKTPRG